MNVAKIIARAMRDANVVRVDETTPRILAQVDLLDWVHEGTQILEKALRNARVDYMMVIRDSTDATFIWEGIQYDIATELNIINTTQVYTLPPDLLRLRRIRATSSNDNDIEFDFMDIANQDFIDLEQATNPQRQVLYYDMLDDQQIYIPNAPTGAIDVEIAYVCRSRYPYIDSGTSVALTQADATVTGTSTTWLQDERYYPAEFMFHSSGTNAAPVLVSQTSSDDFINPGTKGWPLAIQTYPGVPIASETSVELATPYTPATDAEIGWMLASVPLPPPEHHHIIIDFVHAKIKERLQMYSEAQSVMQSMQMKLAQFRQDIRPRQSMHFEHAEDYEVY